MLYRIDLPNNPESKVLVEACLKALAGRFDGAQRQTQPVTVDTGVGNAARISKIYGTWVMKGDATPERPHRIARILSAPATLGTVTEIQLAALAAQVPQQTAQRPRSAAPAAGYARSSVIDAFNQMHDCAAILERHGYRKHGPRWIAPGSSSGLPGVTQLPHGRVYSHHRAGPLNDGHAHDAFSLYATLEHERVLIVEDIIDSGYTLSKVVEILRTRNPQDIRICTLLDKHARRKVDMAVDYVGFAIEDKFVFGYGLDLDEKFRNLPFIGVVDLDRLPQEPE